jgi:O-acetyl-ADP-ribose deacetylase (regulator of RNase III)
VIRYVTGDATAPISKPAIICHIVNDEGAWGAGFVMALSKRWPDAERHYRAWAASKTDLRFALGITYFVRVEEDISIAHMCAQHAFGEDGEPPIRYEALERCLDRVALTAEATGKSVHMPRIGCGLAGGDWGHVGALVERTMGNLDVTVYDLEAR